MNEKQFKPFQQVLVRDSEEKQWSCSLYSHYNTKYNVHICANGRDFKYCIPYEGNEALLGTADEPKPKRWRAKNGGLYWALDINYVAHEVIELYSRYDDKLYSVGNYFRTKEEAQVMADRFKAMLKGGKA